MRKSKKIMSFVLAGALIITGFNVIRPCGGPGDLPVIITLVKTII